MDIDVTVSPAKPVEDRAGSLVGMLIGLEILAGQPPALVVRLVADEEHPAVGPQDDEVRDQLDVGLPVSHRYRLLLGQQGLLSSRSSVPRQRTLPVDHLGEPAPTAPGRRAGPAARGEHPAVSSEQLGHAALVLEIRPCREGERKRIADCGQLLPGALEQLGEMADGPRS